MRHLLAALTIFATLGIWSSDAYAVTQVTRDVNGTCTDNGDGSSAECAKGGPGSAGAHSNLCYAIEAERAIGVDLVSRDVNVTINLINGASPDTCTNTGSNLSVHTVQPYPGGGAGATFTKDATHRFLLVGDPSDPYQIEIAQAVVAGTYNEWRYFDIGSTGDPANTVQGANGSIIESNIIHCDSNTSQTTGVQILNSPGFPESRVVNNIIYGCGYGIYVASQIGSALDYARIGLYNNTIIDAAVRGIHVHTCGSIPFPDCGRCSATDEAKSALFLSNNLIQDSGTSDFGYGSSCNDLADCCFFSLGANATSDATSPDGSAFQNQTASFTNAGGRDYTLTQNDEACLYKGTDLRQDTFYPFGTDFQGEERGFWSCGGDNGTPSVECEPLSLQKVSRGRQP